MTDKVQSTRFRVYKYEGVIQVHGAINDTTTYNVFDEMVADPSIAIDLSALKAASWLGLTNFCKYLNKLNKKVEISNIPANIFKYFKLVSDLSDNVTVKSMNIILVKNNRFVAHKSEENLLKEKIKNSQFVEIDDGVVFGFANHSCIRYPIDVEKTKNEYKHVWCKNNYEEVTFFFNYLFFSSATVGLAADIVRSVGVSLFELLSNIITRMNNAFEGVKLISPETPSDKVEKLRKLLEVAQEECDREAAKIEQVLYDLESIILIMQGKLLAPDGTDKKDFFDPLQIAKARILTCVQLSKIMEDIGANIGGGILSLTDFSELHKEISKANEEAITEEILSNIRDKFNIMDPMSADSWSDTKAEIFVELKQIDSDISRCTVVLQGFDLTRQVLEHRITESEYLNESLPKVIAEQIIWLDLKEKLSSMIADKLVTEQEKAAYAFYLPEGYEAYKTGMPRKNPGDVLLF